MALQQACYVENGKTVGGVIPDASSAIGYKENVGGTCVNPNGYTAGSYFMASNNGYMYKALTNIARGDAFRIGTNCEQTNVSSELNSINAELTDKISYPDLDNLLETSTSVPYTVQHNGWFIGWFGNNTGTIRVNGKIVGGAVGEPGYYGSTANVQIPVKVGDIISATGGLTVSSGYPINIYGSR
jgi:hypothetical protein